jgi:hypothetical protein
MYSACDHLTVGFPHSEIRGSKGARPSPRLIAACHVLHRLSVPRHPPNALKTLDRLFPSKSTRRGNYPAANHTVICRQWSQHSEECRNHSMRISREDTSWILQAFPVRAEREPEDPPRSHKLFTMSNNKGPDLHPIPDRVSSCRCEIWSCVRSFTLHRVAVARSAISLALPLDKSRCDLSRWWR